MHGLRSTRLDLSAIRRKKETRRTRGSFRCNVPSVTITIQTTRGAPQPAGRARHVTSPSAGRPPRTRRVVLSFRPWARDRRLCVGGARARSHDPILPAGAAVKSTPARPKISHHATPFRPTGAVTVTGGRGTRPLPVRSRRHRQRALPPDPTRRSPAFPFPFPEDHHRPAPPRVSCHATTREPPRLRAPGTTGRRARAPHAATPPLALFLGTRY